MPNHIATSPLTGRIFMGRVNKSGSAFVGQKADVTSDVLRSVIEKAEFHGGGFEIEGGSRKWAVTVSEKFDTGVPCKGPGPGAEVEAVRYAPLISAVESILDDGHMNQEQLARLRNAWEEV